MSKRRFEAALALLAFPVAVGLTVLAITTPAAGSRRAEPVGAAAARVSVLGGDAVPAFGLADRLVERGFDVVAVGPDENSVGSTTEVVYYERSHRDDAERLRDILGVGTIRREQVFSPSADLTILIGKDLHST